MSVIDIRAPAAEESEGTRLQLLRWLKQVGEHVAENEPLIEIETDKVTVEVASPAAGVLREILRRENEEVDPGELLGRLESSIPSAADERPEPPANLAAPPGSGAAAPPRAAPARANTPALSPAVRRLLATRGLEASSLTGTGEGGRLTVEDVLNAAGNISSQGGARSRPPPSEPTVAQPPLTVRRVPHTPIRRRIAEHLTQSLLHIAPHVTTVFEADLAAVQQDRARRREEFAQQGVPLTLTAYFVRATVAAIRAVPEANSRWTESALEIYEPIHLGIATAVEGSGLLVPVLRDAQTLDLLATARALDALTARARGGRLTPAEVRGGTFTISNHGVSGSLLAAPIIINQPQSAILGVGKLENRAVVIEDGEELKISVRPRCYVTLTLDHRVMDGHQANRFMVSFVQCIENWPRASELNAG